MTSAVTNREISPTPMTEPPSALRNRPVELIVPFPPGGVTDIAAGSVAEFLTQRWDSPVVVRHLAGDGGATGTLHVLGSAPDGCTMLMCATGQATQNPALRSDSPYRWDDPTLIARVVSSPLVFVVSTRSPWKSLREFMHDVSRDPSSYAYGTSGVGGIGSIAAARVLSEARIDPLRLRRLRMNGGAGMLEAVVSGTTHFAVQYLAEMKPLIESGQLRALAVSAPTRVGRLPNVATGREAGFPVFDLMGWSGVAGPPGLSQSLIDRWSEALRALTGNESFKAGIETLGGSAAYLGPSDFKAALAQEFQTAQQFAKTLGLHG